MTQGASNKRARDDAAADDSRAECPFSVRIVDPREKELKTKGKKRRKRPADDGADDGKTRKVLHQCAPFAPKGAFETHSTMDVHYVVEPAKQWSDMTRYNSFVLNGVKYYCEGFIYVANDSSIERQKNAAASSAGGGAGASGTSGASGAAEASGASAASGAAAGASASAARDVRRRSEDDWVARILEIRASDEHHVYARVFWMYWPDELPAGTHYGKRQVQGRQPYHGASELIASNHMDIINVVSVTTTASVNHLNEDKDDDVQNALYWRQALDVRNMELSLIDNVCACGQPANPDKMLVGCGDKNCGKWIHEECLKHYALMRVYERLGRDRPHMATKKPELAATASAGTPIKSESGPDDVKEPLSPRETGGAVSAQHSIDVKAGTGEGAGAAGDVGKGSGEAGETGEAGDDEGQDAVSRPNGATSDVAVRGKRKSGGGSGDAAAVTPPLKRETLTPTPTTATSRARKTPSKGAATMTTTTSGGKRTFPSLRSFEGRKKPPYDKLFEATLLLTPLNSAAPTMIEIRDLRTGLPAGAETVWLEPAECPVCGSAIR